MIRKEGIKIKFTFTSAAVIRRLCSRIKLYKWVSLTQFDTSNELKWSVLIPPPGKVHKNHPCRQPELVTVVLVHACPGFACTPVNGVSRKKPNVWPEARRESCASEGQRGSIIISSQLLSRGRGEIREEDGEVGKEYQMMGAMEVNYCKWKVSLKHCEELGWVSTLFIHYTICLRTIKHPSVRFCLPRSSQITLQFLNFVFFNNVFFELLENVTFFQLTQYILYAWEACWCILRSAKMC